MFVSLCVIAYNEENFLPGLFKDITEQIFSHKDMEIILVDAMSADSTRALMEDFRLKNADFRRIEILENPKGTQPSGWNVAITAASGDVIIRIDAHAHIPPDFVVKNVECLYSGENISGGPRPNLILNETPWKHTLLLAESSMFGSSIASYRRGSKAEETRQLDNNCLNENRKSENDKIKVNSELRYNDINNEDIEFVGNSGLGSRQLGNNNVSESSQAEDSKIKVSNELRYNDINNEDIEFVGNSGLGSRQLGNNNVSESSQAKDSKISNKKYVKSMFHAAYRREVFEKVGLFNEKLIRTEDNELHYRMREAGYKFCYDDSIRSYQYTRSSFSGMVKQKFQNGVWIGITAFVCPKCLSLYHFFPGLFAFAILLTSIIACIGAPLLAMLLWGAYWLLNLAVSALTVVGEIIKKKFNITVLLLPFLFLILHIFYGVGTLCGVIKRKP